MNPSNPSIAGVSIDTVIEDKAVYDLIVEGRGAVRAARVAARDQRTPPWKTPAGKAAKARLRRNKTQRNARKANR